MANKEIKQIDEKKEKKNLAEKKKKRKEKVRKGIIISLMLFLVLSMVLPTIMGALQ